MGVRLNVQVISFLLLLNGKCRGSILWGGKQAAILKWGCANRRADKLVSRATEEVTHWETGYNKEISPSTGIFCKIPSPQLRLERDQIGKCTYQDKSGSVLGSSHHVKAAPPPSQLCGNLTDCKIEG